MTCDNTLRPPITEDDIVVAPGCGDIFLPYGTDNELVLVVKDEDQKAIDITADTVILTVKDGRGGNQIFQKTNAPGGHSDPTEGETAFAIDAADISTAQPYETTTWRYEVRRTAAGGEISAHLAGLFIVEPTI